jgi:hypothetical protein
VKALSFLICAQIIHQTYGLSKKNMMKAWRIAQIRFNIVEASNCPDKKEKANPIRTDMSIAIILFHLLERFAPVMKRIIKGAITPISPASQSGAIFILNHLF